MTMEIDNKRYGERDIRKSIDDIDDRKHQNSREDLTWFFRRAHNLLACSKYYATCSVHGCSLRHGHEALQSFDGVSAPDDTKANGLDSMCEETPASPVEYVP